MISGARVRSSAPSAASGALSARAKHPPAGGQNRTMPIRLGYKASAEQFAPRPLLDFSIAAERHGFDIVAVSDHFQPWRHHGGHAPNALVWLGALGERTDRVVLQTSVLTPTLRYHPSTVAHTFATLGALNPGRVVLGVGSGEAMNETPATGAAWPKFKERSERLAESIELIRQLWVGERVSFAGSYYRTEKATIYDKPEQPVPIYVAAGGPKAAQLVGRIGDGFICTSGKGEELYHTLLDSVGEGAREMGRDPAAIVKNIEVKVSYDHDAAFAKDACRPWAALALTAEEKGGTEDPIEMERLAEGALDRAHQRFIVSADPDEVVEKIGWYVDLGFEELVFHFPGDDQVRALDQFAADIAPRLRERYA
jgi:coenzyme F420-dependent glucose-6-phosphate dehydrogenase